jgi:hypothetical protein
MYLVTLPGLLQVWQLVVVVTQVQEWHPAAGLKLHTDNPSIESIHTNNQ